jgi:hypothetical protein
MLGIVPLKPYLMQLLPKMSDDKCHLLIVNGSFQHGYLEYTARLLLLDYRDDPVQVLTLVRAWLEQHKRHQDAAGNDITLSFSSEIIDNNTFDLELDFPQREKVVFSEQTYHICSDPVWDEALGKFVRSGD